MQAIRRFLWGKARRQEQRRRQPSTTRWWGGLRRAIGAMALDSWEMWSLALGSLARVSAFGAITDVAVVVA